MSTGQQSNKVAVVEAYRAEIRCNDEKQYRVVKRLLNEHDNLRRAVSACAALGTEWVHGGVIVEASEQE